MTTQNWQQQDPGHAPAQGYEPPFQPQEPSVYPTAPPWASHAQAYETAPAAYAYQAPAPAAHAYQAPAPAPAYQYQAPQIGGLLVPYPEEIRTAARAEAPRLWPVAVFTFFSPLGIAGAISAARRADQARRGANHSSPYWIAFLITLFAGGFIWAVVGLTVVLPAVHDYQQTRTVAALEHNVISDGQLAKANITAESASCQAAGDENNDGTRDFLCQLSLKGGEKGQLSVTADSDGTWTPTK